MAEFEFVDRSGACHIQNYCSKKKFFHSFEELATPPAIGSRRERFHFGYKYLAPEMKMLEIHPRVCSILLII